MAGEDDCWLWTATLINSGYGRIYYEGKTVLAHRLAYQLWVGDIPDGMTIDHTCHGPDCLDGVQCLHRRCVNPAHLEVVTQQVNLLRGATLVAFNAGKTHCPQGHPYDEANTRTYPSTGRICRQCEIDRTRRRSGKTVVRIR